MAKKKEEEEDYDDLRRVLVNLIKHEMVDQNLKGTDLANLSGVSQSYLSEFFNGRRRGSLSVVSRIFKALGVRVEITLSKK